MEWLSNPTPWDELEAERDTDERLEDLKEFVRLSNEREAKRRWLLMLRSADGAERVDAWIGRPPDPYFTALTLPLRVYYAADAAPTAIDVGATRREYRLVRLRHDDGVAEYEEDRR